MKRNGESGSPCRTPCVALKFSTSFYGEGGVLVNGADASQRSDCEAHLLQSQPEGWTMDEVKSLRRVKEADVKKFTVPRVTVDQ